MQPTPPPGPPPPPPPGGGGQQPSNGLGLASMIIGIVSIPLMCCYIGIAGGIVAAVLGFLGKAKADRGEATNRGQAIAGIICGIIAAALGIVLTILSLWLNTIDLQGWLLDQE